jgi:hypothetical protein
MFSVSAQNAKRLGPSPVTTKHVPHDIVRAGDDAVGEGIHSLGMLGAFSCSTSAFQNRRPAIGHQDTPRRLQAAMIVM